MKKYSRAGFTLAEVMMSLLIMMPLVIVALALMVTSLKQFQLGEQQFTAGTQARLLQSRFIRDATGCQAYQIFNDFNTRESATAGNMIVMVSFTDNTDANGDGLPDESLDKLENLTAPTIKRVTCYYLDAPNPKARTTNSTSARIIDTGYRLRRLSTDEPVADVSWPVTLPYAIPNNTKFAALVPTGATVRAKGREVANLDVTQLGNVLGRTGLTVPTFIANNSVISATFLLRAGTDKQSVITPLHLNIPTLR